MSPRTPEATTLIAIHLITSDSIMIMVSLRLDYYVSDPYAVHAHFTSADGPTTTWVFARDLIRTGLNSSQATPAGLGDVRVWRDLDPEYVLMGLDGDDGQALLAAPAEPVERFLQATRALVPYGSEADHSDAAITGLLASILTP